MNEVIIAGYLRTPNSRSSPKDPSRDVFNPLRADELLAPLIPELLDRSRVPAETVDDLIVGCALGIGEQWTYGGRTTVFQANLPATVSAKFLDQQCGSSMAAVHMAYMQIAMGYADVVVACGMEHMTRIPIGPKLYASGLAHVNPALFKDPAYAHWDLANAMNMGLTAENLFENTDLTRRDLDAWGVRSHKLTYAAYENGFMAGEILPVEVPQEDGSVLTVDRDQCVRPDASMEKMATLKTVFKEDGVITPGNASPLNAGAGAMVLVSADMAARLGLDEMALVRSIGFAGCDPTIMGAAPVPAASKALAACGLDPGDIDTWEINEAFAVVVLNMARTLNIDPDRINVNGGALAIGHAMGATGVRIVGTLARTLAAGGGRYGCAAACIGGGQGIATIIEHRAG